MIFWTRVKQAINNLWYPRSVTVGKPVETQELANRFARESTVSPADTHAVLRALPNIMAGFMKESRAVHFEGLGWFRNTTVSAGNGVATREEVSSDQITGLRVQFTPDRIRNMSGGYTRALIADEGITFMEWLGKESDFLRHQHSRHLHPLQQMNATAFFLARLELPPARYAFFVYDRSVPRLRQANHCVGCNECSPNCLQAIRIPQELKR